MSRQLTINKNKKTTMAALPTNPNRKKKLSLSSSTSSGSGSKDDDEVIVEKTVKGKGKPCKAMGRGDCGHLGVTVKHKCIDCGEGVHNKLPCGVPVGGGKYRCDWCTQEKDSNDGKNKDDSEAETGPDGEAFDYVQQIDLLSSCCRRWQSATLSILFGLSVNEPSPMVFSWD